MNLKQAIALRPSDPERVRWFAGNADERVTLVRAKGTAPFGAQCNGRCETVVLAEPWTDGPMNYRAGDKVRRMIYDEIVFNSKTKHECAMGEAVELLTAYPGRIDVK